jgi:tetratricopeptide (TPR) repeat protein
MSVKASRGLPLGRWRWWTIGVVALATTSAGGARAESLADRQSADINDLLAVERQHPAALATLKEAEQLLAQGKADVAAHKLESARAEAPKSTVIARRYCQALMQLGQRSSAINACEAALERGRSPMSARALVGALMMAPPTPDELAQALKLAERAKIDLATQPYGYAAECDIARRLGDRAMYKNCLEHLETMAPGHYETVRAQSLGGFAATPRWVPMGWLLLAACGLASAVHAAWNGLRRRRLAPVVGLLVTLAVSGHAVAQDAATPAPMVEQAPVERALNAPGGLSKWKINDADPLKSLPTPQQRDSDPLNYGYHLMDLADKAQLASQKGDFAAASKYWEATVLAVPDVALGYRKTCETAEKAKNMNRAFRYCRAALGQSGVVLADYEHYFALLQASPDPLPPEQLTDLLEMSKHVRELPSGERLADAIDCEYGLRASDWPRLETCSKKLAASAPNDPRTITYQWALALGQERFDEARSLIERARKTAMKPQGIAAMEVATAQRASVLSRLKQRPKAVVAVLIGALVLGASLGISRLLARRRNKSSAVSPVVVA